MKNDIKKKYELNDKLTQEAIDTNGKEKYDSYKFIKVFSPIYFIDLYGFGYYSKIDNLNESCQEYVTVKYKYVNNNNSFCDFFSIVEKCTFPKREETRILYKGFPIYSADINKKIYLPPQKDIIFLNEEANSEFFENLIVDIANKDYDFKKRFMVTK